MHYLLKYIALFLFFISANCIYNCGNSLVLAQTNLEILNKSLESLPTKNKIDVILDSAEKYFKIDIVKCVSFSELALSNIDNKITDDDKVGIYGRVSGYYNTLGNYSKAMEYLLTELTILEKSGTPSNLKIGKCYVNIGETYRAAADYNNALLNLNKSVLLFSGINNDDGQKGLSHSYERLAAVYFELCYKSDSSLVWKAIEYSDKSIEIAEKYNLISRKINNWNILGACQVHLNNYNKALEIFNTALNESYKDSTYADRSNIVNNISNCYYYMLEYAKAIEYAKQSYSESKKRGVAIYVREACLILYKSYVAMKIYDKALLYLDEYNTVSFELFNNEKNRVIDALEQKRLKEKYDEDARDQKNEIYYISALISVFLVLVIFIFVVRQRDLKKINKELEIRNEIISKQKSEIEDVSATKDKFFSILAHDLRNPFNGILGFLNILQNDFDSITYGEKRQYIGYISKSANQVFKLLDRLLELSRLQDGRYQFKKENINLKEMVEQICHLQETNAQNKRVNLIIKITEDISINADKASLGTIIRNLVDNAIKFTSAGGEVVLSSFIKDGNYEVIISDTGVGMDIDDVQNIFRLDKKSVAVGTNNEKGTGLGLAVCNELVEKMGGKINVESEIGRGSKFTLIFPA